MEFSLPQLVVKRGLLHAYVFVMKLRTCHVHGNFVVRIIKYPNNRASENRGFTVMQVNRENLMEDDTMQTLDSFSACNQELYN